MSEELIVKSNVKVICTTDAPVDSLEYHQLLKEDHTFNVSVLPSFRPDKGLEINRGDAYRFKKLLVLYKA